MKTILIDDEDHSLKTLSYEINRHCPEINIVCTCKSGKEGLLAIKQHEPDLVFLDIQMPYMTGFEMLEILGEIKFEIIFTTAFDKFALEAFKNNPFDYLLKPIDGAYLKKRCLSLKKKILEKNELLKYKEQSGGHSLNRLVLPTSNGFLVVNPEEIIYLKADGNYTLMFLENDTKVLLSKTLKEIEKKLSQEIFYRVHKSYVVNLTFIKSYIKSGDGKLVMSNGDEVKISRAKKSDLLNHFS